MSKPFVCPVLSGTTLRKRVWITEGKCLSARQYHHHYCQRCEKNADPPAAKPVAVGKYIKLIWVMLNDAVDVYLNNDDRVGELQKKWSNRREPVRNTEKILFLKNLQECVEMKTDIVDARAWFLSDDRRPGDFLWACTQLGTHYGEPEKTSPEKCRERLGLNGTAKGSGCAHPELQPAGNAAPVSECTA